MHTTRRSRHLVWLCAFALLITTQAPLVPAAAESPNSSSLSAAPVCAPAFQWRWNEAPPGFTNEACGNPISVRLVDTNGNGAIEETDVPSTIFHHEWDTDLGTDSYWFRAVDGRTGVEQLAIELGNMPGPWHAFTNSIAAADIDADGFVELLGIRFVHWPDDTQLEVVAYEHDGTFKWNSGALMDIGATGLAMTPGIADVDQDGTPEVYAGPNVVNADGSVRWIGTAGRGTWFKAPVTTVLDLVPSNPGLELLAGNTAYDASTGAIVWENTDVGDGWTAVADFDDDGDPEIVLLTSIAQQNEPKEFYLLDHLGTILGPPYVINDTGSPPHPVIADVDGDRQPEVIFGDRSELRVLDWDGTQWVPSWPLDLGGGIGSIAAYDFDGDCASEIVVGATDGTHTLYIVDGRTGDILSETEIARGNGEPRHLIVADIDNDDVTEIVVSGCSRSPDADGMFAFECTIPGQPARSVWNQYQYHVTNIDEVGQVPIVEAPSWSEDLNGWLEQIPAAGPPECGCGRSPTCRQCPPEYTCGTADPNTCGGSCVEVENPTGGGRTRW